MRPKKKKKTLLERLVKCHVYDCKYAEAKQVISQISDGDLRVGVSSVLNAAASRSGEDADRNQQRIKVLERLPLFFYRIVGSRFISTFAGYRTLTAGIGIMCQNTTASAPTEQRRRSKSSWTHRARLGLSNLRASCSAAAAMRETSLPPYSVFLPLSRGQARHQVPQEPSRHHD